MYTEEFIRMMFTVDLYGNRARLTYMETVDWIHVACALQGANLFENSV